MKKLSVKSLVLMFCFSLFTSVYADTEVAITAVDTAILEAIVGNEKAVVFNGRKYKYTIDEKQSILSMDESEPKPLKLSELKVGQSYYFEKVIFEKLHREPSVQDFRHIIFITDGKSMVIE